MYSGEDGSIPSRGSKFRKRIMIECMTADQIVYFISIMGDIVTMIDSTTYMIEAQAQTVYWEMINNDLWCIKTDK